MRARRFIAALILATPLALPFAIGACNSGKTKRAAKSTLSAPPKFTISLPAKLEARTGAMASVAIDINRQDYLGPVFFWVTGLPAGVSVPNVSSTYLNQYQLPLRVDSGAAPGTTSVYVRSMGLDIPGDSALLTLTVSKQVSAAAK